MTPEETAKLNPGIRDTVAWLRAHGFTTTDSGGGATHEFECDLAVPYVHIRVAAAELVSESRRLYRLLQARHLPLETVEYGATIQATYDPHSGIGIVSLFCIDDAALARGKTE